MITMTMTRQAAEAVRGAVGALPVGGQANVEAYQAVTAALEKDMAERRPAMTKAAVERAAADLDQALNQRLASGLHRDAAAPASNTFPVYLSAEDIGDLSRWVRATGTIFAGSVWTDRVLAALRGAR